MVYIAQEHAAAAGWPRSAQQVHAAGEHCSTTGDEAVEAGPHYHMHKPKEPWHVRHPALDCKP